MLLNQEIPPIVAPGKQNPANYSPFYPEYDFIDPYGTHVVQGHFWRRIKATHVPCGDSSFSLEVSYKRGISETLLAEIASALELSVAPLKSTLSSKINASNTFTDEETIKYTRNLKPRPNHAIRTLLELYRSGYLVGGTIEYWVDDEPVNDYQTLM
jgi:hypothetical protein